MMIFQKNYKILNNLVFHSISVKKFDFQIQTKFACFWLNLEWIFLIFAKEYFDWVCVDFFVMTIIPRAIHLLQTKLGHKKAIRNHLLEKVVFLCVNLSKRIKVFLKIQTLFYWIQKIQFFVQFYIFLKVQNQSKRSIQNHFSLSAIDYLALYQDGDNLVRVRLPTVL